MKATTVLAVFGGFGATLVSANPHRSRPIAKSVHNAGLSRHVHGRALPGLTDNQNNHAQEIIAQVENNKMGMHGCQTVLAIAFTESELRMLANAAVPESLKYTNDGMGAEKDSVGLFQMRAEFFKDVGCSMAAGCSTRIICDEIKTVNGWETMDVATLCQTVQRSEIPDAYNKYTATAAQICQASKKF